jgi:hypothetical protein
MALRIHPEQAAVERIVRTSEPVKPQRHNKKHTALKIRCVHQDSGFEEQFSSQAKVREAGFSVHFVRQSIESGELYEDRRWYRDTTPAEQEEADDIGEPPTASELAEMQTRSDAAEQELRDAGMIE